MLFNLLTVLSPTAEGFVVACLLDGLPHGAFFGVATLVAADMLGPERRGRVVASVLLGLTVANIVGVPAAAWLGQAVGWRASYAACALLAAVAAAMIALFITRRPAPVRSAAGGELEHLSVSGTVVPGELVAGQRGDDDAGADGVDARASLSPADCLGLDAQDVGALGDLIGVQPVTGPIGLEHRQGEQLVRRRGRPRCPGCCACRRRSIGI